MCVCVWGVCVCVLVYTFVYVCVCPRMHVGRGAIKRFGLPATVAGIMWRFYQPLNFGEFYCIVKMVIMYIAYSTGMKRQVYLHDRFHTQAIKCALHT